MHLSVPQIVFQSDRDGNSEIYRMDTNGKNPVRLTDDRAEDRNPSLSPDGKKVAFVSNKSKIIVMDIDGGNKVVISKNLPSLYGEKGKLCWSPDGTRIAFVCSVPLFRDNSVVFLDDIFVMNEC